MKKTIGIAVVVIIFLSSCAHPAPDSIEKYPINVGSFIKQGGLKIDSKKILSALDRGDSNVFQPIDEAPDTQLFSEQFEWSQADYEKIAKAVFQFVWKEPTDMWTLYRFKFDLMNCRDEPKGFNYADFFYYQEIKIDNKPLYSVRAISIEPQYGYIAWGGETNYPHPIFGWKSVKLDELKVPAEEALGLAESRGGQAFRLTRNNICSIVVTMYPESYSYGGWVVTYFPGDIHIHPLEIRISGKRSK